MPEKMICPSCGAEMNHHADKLLASDSELSSKTSLGGALIQLHSCLACGSSASRCVSG